MSNENEIKEINLGREEQFDLLRIELISARVILLLISLVYPMYVGLIMYFFPAHNNPFIVLLGLTSYSLFVLIASFVNKFVIKRISNFLYSVCFGIVVHLVLLNTFNEYRYEFSTPLLVILIVFSMFFKNLKQLTAYYIVVLSLIVASIRYTDEKMINVFVYLVFLFAGSIVSYFSLFTKLYVFDSTLRFIHVKEREIKKRQAVENSLLTSNEQLKIKNDSLYELEEHLKKVNLEVIKLTEELEETKELNQEVFKFKSKFLKDLNFEVRSRFNDITVGAHLLKREGLEGKAADYAKMIDSAINKLLKDVSNLYEITLVQSDRMELNYTDYNPKELFDRLKVTFDLEKDYKQIDFVFESDDSIPSHLQYDQTRIIQVLTQLLKNAIIYTESGEIRVKVSLVKKENETDPEKLLFEVMDTGIGIPKRILDKVNESLFYANKDNIEDYKLDGDDVILVKYIVDRMGGEFGIESEFEKGSTFWFTCKMYQEIEELEEESEIDSKVLEGMDVLLVDDVLSNRSAISKMLSDVNVSVSTVGTGRECVDALEMIDFDVVLLDVKLEDMDLDTVLKEIAQLGKEMNLIALSSMVSQDQMDQLLAKGFRAVIKKPVQEEELISTLIQLKS